MPVDKRYRMKILESKEVVKTERRPARIRKVSVRPSTQEIVRAFKRAPGYEEIVARIPKAATVECLIDNSSFGPLPFTGTIVQPHFSVLSAGGHHFRIRQQNGAFFFLSLTVYSF